MEFERNIEENIFNLADDIIKERFVHGEYSKFIIKDNKKRTINKSSVRDKLVHQLVYDRLLIKVENKLIFHTYSSRKKKGLHKMIKYIHLNIKNYYNNQKQVYVLKMDIRKYFASIDHEILFSKIKEIENNKQTLFLAKKIIKSFCSSKENGLSKGLPLGNITSQIFSNLYLSDFDWLVVDNFGLKVFYARYNDDLIFILNRRYFLFVIMTKAKKYLKTKLLLECPQEKCLIINMNNGVKILGTMIGLNKTILPVKTKLKILINLNKNNLSSYLGLLKNKNEFDFENKIKSLI